MRVRKDGVYIGDSCQIVGRSLERYVKTYICLHIYICVHGKKMNIYTSKTTR